MTSQIELAFSHCALSQRTSNPFPFQVVAFVVFACVSLSFCFCPCQFLSSCSSLVQTRKLDPSVLFRVSSIILGTICYRLYIIFLPLPWTGTSLIGSFRMDWMLRIHMISNKRFISFLSNLNLITCLPLSLSLKGGCVKIWPIWEWEKDSLQKTKDAPVRTNPSADTIEREENC